jgi:hypothetical protein
VTAGTKRLAAAYLALSQRLSATTNMDSTATPYPINPACPLDQRLLRKFLITQFSILMGYVFIPEAVDGIYHGKQISLRHMLFFFYSVFLIVLPSPD